MPQWSRMTAPVMTRSGAPSARVVRAWPIDSRITFPPPKTASSPPAAQVLLDLDEQVGVGEPDPVARPSARTAARSAPGSISLIEPARAVRTSRQPPAADAVRAPRRPASGDQRRPRAPCPARIAPRCPPGCPAGSPGPTSRSKRQRRLAWAKWKCEPDLHRPVAGVRHRQRRRPGDRRSGRRARRRGRSRRGSRDRLVHGDELGPVGEGGLDLHLGQHLGHPLHHVVAA